MTPITISVITPSFLSPYPGAVQNQKQCFVRAINSFLSCQHPSAELIVISDGCQDTIEILERNYRMHLESGRIKLLKLPRHPLFTGTVRQAGIDLAQGEIITNLDTDDSLAPHHLHNLEKVFNLDKMDWCYWNYTRKLDILRGVTELVNVDGSLDSLCTMNIAWKKSLDVTWIGADGRQDNKRFIAQLMEKYPRYKKVYGNGTFVHHTTNIRTA